MFMVAAILITCTQSFSNNKHKGNCGGSGRRGGGGGQPCTCETKNSLPQGSLWGNREEITLVFAVIAIHYSRGRKQRESGFAGNIVGNIEG